MEEPKRRWYSAVAHAKMSKSQHWNAKRAAVIAIAVLLLAVNSHGVDAQSNSLANGSLTIKNFVVTPNGSPPASVQLTEEFTFTVTLSDMSKSSVIVEINGVEKSLPVVNSNISLTLRHGDVAVFSDIPDGTVFRVREASETGYIISSENTSGNMTQSGIEAVFTNTYIESLDVEGSLTVTNQVIGQGADMDKIFTFTATFTGAAVPNPVKYQVNGGVIQDLSTNGQFALANGDHITFLNLPAGVEYAINASDYSGESYYPNRYFYSGTVTRDNIVLPFSIHYIAQSLEDQVAGFLEITKQVTGVNGSHAQAFDFTISLTPPAYTTLPDPILYILDGGAEVELASDGRIELKHGETAVFTNLPQGTRYTIVEDITSAAGYVSSVQKMSGMAIAFETAACTFVNTALAEPPHNVQAATIIVRKEVKGEVPEKYKGKVFNFRLLINGRVTEAFNLKDGESATFGGIPAGATYEVLEGDYFADQFYGTVENGYGTANGLAINALVTNSYARAGSDESGNSGDPGDTGDQGGAENDQSAEPVQTGDDTNLTGWFTVLLLSGLSMLCVLMWRNGGARKIQGRKEARKEARK